MIIVGESIVGLSKNITSSVYSIGSMYSSDYEWIIEIILKNLVIKKRIIIGSSTCIIKKINFKINEKGPANAKINFAYIDWSIDYNDTVKIYYRGSLVYSGIVDSINYDSGEITVIPIRTRLEKIIFPEKSYTSNITSAYDVLIDVILTKQEWTSIYWNETLIDNNFLIKAKNTEMFDPAKEEALKIDTADIKKTIEDIIKIVDSDSTWGIDSNNNFFVRYPSDIISKQLFLGKNPDYTEIKIKKENSDTKLTRAIVYRKGNTEKDPPEEENVFCGYVCYGEDPANNKFYEPLKSLENEAGIIEEIVNVDAVCYKSTAIEYAYNKIKSQLTAQSIEIKNLNIKKYFPYPHHKIRVEKIYNYKIMNTIIDCQSIGNWFYVNSPNDVEFSLDNIKSIYNEYCVKVSSLITGDVWIEYKDLEKKIILDGIEKIEIVLSSDLKIKQVEVNILNNSVVVNSSITSINSNGIMIIEIRNMIRFDTIRFNIVNDDFNEAPLFYIHRIRAFSYTRETFETNIKEIDFTIDKTGCKCNLTCGKYDYQYNDRLQELETKIKRLGNIGGI